jgi:cytochrome c-type biogenesis protein CcmH
VSRLVGLLAVLMLLLSPAIALAADPSEMLSDPKLEARAEAVGNGLRCLVCQNESIEASDADLAHDLRLLVRQRIAAGDTDDQVRAYIVSRYGEFVLLKPVFALHTLLLWLLAPGLIVIGGIVLFVMARRRRDVLLPETLSAEEAEALEHLAGPESEG